MASCAVDFPMSGHSIPALISGHSSLQDGGMDVAGLWADKYGSILG